MLYLESVDRAASLSPITITLYITFFFGIFLVISLQKITNESFSFLGRYSNNLLITLGAMTYPLYLLHNSISRITIEFMKKLDIPLYITLPFVLILIVMLTLLANLLDMNIHSLWKRTPTLRSIIEKNSPLLFEKLRKIL